MRGQGTLVRRACDKFMGSEISSPASRSYVFSRTLKAVDDPGVELVAQDAAGSSEG
jgi:hypothetical protein